MADSASIVLHFDLGTITAAHLPPQLHEVMPFDERTQVHRAPAERYREVVLYLHERQIPFEDRARQFDRLDLAMVERFDPFPHQRDALRSWLDAQRRGIVELPTGAGKTFLAVLAMEQTQRSTLIVVPTIDLLTQWHGILEKRFGMTVGMLGGGVKDRQSVTVTTYDSAAMQTEFHGNAFGLIIFDECHHLPAPAYQFIASGSVAPFRLGLTATLERTDGGEEICEALIGPRVFAMPIDALEGEYLAPYDVVQLEVELSEADQKRYNEAREIYIDFLRSSRVNLSRPNGWAQFIGLCHSSAEGRRAFRAYREQRSIAFTSDSKLQALWEVLLRHRHERTIVFTEDNETVYRLSKAHLFPTITHQTKAPERKWILDQFSKGELPVILTSRVLNEGVDVPDANVGVVLSGSGSVREHVQRLGRILRKRPNKRAVLYEICTAETSESNVSERRRQHRAYRR